MTQQHDPVTDRFAGFGISSTTIRLNSEPRCALTVDSKSLTEGVYVKVWTDGITDPTRFDLTVPEALALIGALRSAVAATTGVMHTL